MKVLFELTHTGVDYEIMKARHQFFVFGPKWDFSNRPSNPNAVLGASADQDADVAVVGSLDGLAKIRPGIPVVWKCLTDWGKHTIPEFVMNRVTAFVSTCVETADRHGLKDHPKTVIIEQGIDPDFWGEYTGGISKCLSVGNLIMKRPEKGPDVLVAVNKKVPVYLMGAMNDGYSPDRILPCSRSSGDLAEAYQRHQVYFNPSTVIVCAVLEAMATGMPVVTMEPGNYKDLMRHRENCFVASTQEAAVHFIHLLMGNRGLCRDIGAAARASVQYRFHPALTSWKWEKLIERIGMKQESSSGV